MDKKINIIECAWCVWDTNNVSPLKFLFKQISEILKKIALGLIYAFNAQYGAKKYTWIV